MSSTCSLLLRLHDNYIKKYSSANGLQTTCTLCSSQQPFHLSNAPSHSLKLSARDMHTLQILLASCRNPANLPCTSGHEHRSSFFLLSFFFLLLLLIRYLHPAMHSGCLKTACSSSLPSAREDTHNVFHAYRSRWVQQAHGRQAYI